MAKKSDLTNAQINTSYMVDNLAACIFRWDGIPYEMSPPSEMLELMLMKKTKVACFDTTVGPMVLPCTLPRVNQWGLEAEGSAQPIIVGNPGFKIKKPIYRKGELISLPNAPIVLYDQPSHTGINNNLVWYTDALGKLRNAIDSCTMWLKTPVIFECDETQEEAVRSYILKIVGGYDTFVIHKGSFKIDDIKITPTNVTPGILQALHESYSRIRSMMYEELGVPDVNNIKMAQQTQTEVLMPMLDTALKTLGRLYMRRAWADRVNATYGTKISVQALTLGLIEQSLYASTGRPVNLSDLNNNGIPDKLEVKEAE